jgi:tripartite-type tricarboxylate transporter receptor subunit TctC
MKLFRRKLLFLAAGTAGARAFPRLASAGDYSTRPVRIIVPVPAGTGPDTIARFVGQGMSDRLSGQFIVDNRPGAGTNIGIEFVVRAPPDGYTLLLFTTSALTNATVYQNPNFNFIRDIAAVASIGRTRFVLLGGSHLGRGKRLRMGRKGFRKHAVDFVSPATVVPDNLIDDIGHGTAFPVHAATPYHIQNGSY